MGVQCFNNTSIKAHFHINSAEFSQIQENYAYFLTLLPTSFERISTHGRGVWSGMWSMLRLSPDISPLSIMCACDH